MVVSVIRNCNSHTRRKEYLQELGTHVGIDHYGACLQNRPAPEDPKMWTRMYGEAKMRLLASYRFCVALENSVQVCFGAGGFVDLGFWWFASPLIRAYRYVLRPISLGRICVALGNSSQVYFGVEVSGFRFLGLRRSR